MSAMSSALSPMTDFKAWRCISAIATMGCFFSPGLGLLPELRPPVGNTTSASCLPPTQLQRCGLTSPKSPSIHCALAENRPCLLSGAVTCTLLSSVLS